MEPRVISTESTAPVAPVGWVRRKDVDWPEVQRLLARSASANHWTNFGPVAEAVEEQVSAMLDLPDSLGVVATSSGTAALNAISAVEEHKAGRPIRWVVSDFGFQCTHQGPFRDAIVLDCDDGGVLDIDELGGVDPDSYDAVLVTNPFGVLDDFASFEEFGSMHDKVMVADSAGAFDALHSPGASAPIEALSFHHTKPWGFGEGGAMVVAAADLAIARSAINFGLVAGAPLGGVATNGKMSDISAAFILSWLERLDEETESSRRQFVRIRSIAEERGWRMLGSTSTDVSQRVPGCVPLVCDRPVDLAGADALPVVVRQYYQPLVGRRRSTSLFERIVTVPCHSEVARLSDEELAMTLDRLSGNGARDSLPS